MGSGACEYGREVLGLLKRVFRISLAGGRALHCRADLGMVDLVVRRRREVAILEEIIMRDLFWGFRSCSRAAIELGRRAWSAEKACGIGATVPRILTPVVLVMSKSLRDFTTHVFRFFLFSFKKS